MKPNYLDIGGGGEGVGDGDEERGEDQLGGEVHRHHGLEEERFEEVCSVDDKEDEDTWKVGCQQLVNNFPLHYYLQIHSVIRITFNNIVKNLPKFYFSKIYFPT